MLGEIFGPDLLIVLLVVVVVLFGGAAIPKLARNLGSAKKEFEKGIADGHHEDSSSAATDSGSKNVSPKAEGSGPVAPS